MQTGYTEARAQALTLPGYPGDMLEEYLNDMDGRRIIHEVWPLASAEQVAFYQSRLEEADKRFYAATVPAEACIWGETNEAKYGYRPDVDWRYYRVPEGIGLDSTTTHSELPRTRYRRSSQNSPSRDCLNSPDRPSTKAP
jgi:hypothetical protein